MANSSPPHAGQCVFLAQHTTKASGYLYEKLISDSMPIAVIDALEVIEINEQCRYLA